MNPRIFFVCALFGALFLSSLTSCSVLTRSQVEAAAGLSERADTLALAPEAALQLLSGVRTERGLYFTAGLTSAEVRVGELERMYAFRTGEEALIRKASVYGNVLASYMRALKSLTSPARYEQFGTELRGLGRNTDSLIRYYNRLEIGAELPENYAREAGRLLGLGAETWVRHRQAALLRDFVRQSDSLMSVCCDSLAAVLDRGELETMIRHEREALSAEYRHFTARRLSAGTPPGRDEDRAYLELLRTLDRCESLRIRSRSALRSLQRAHRKLAGSLDRRAEIDQVYEEILEFNDICAGLARTLRETDK